MAKEAGVDLTKVDGTGPGGVITEEDVRKAAGEAERAPAEERKMPPAGKPAEAKEGEVKIEAGEGTDRYGPVEKIPLKGIRRTIARNLMASQKSTAFVTGMDEADVTGLWELRKREREVAKEQGVHLTFMPFFMKAVWHALQHHPMLNGSVDDSGEFIIRKNYYNIGVAVDTPDGLMVAVVRDVDKKTIIDLAGELGELGEKAVNRKISLEELKGSSFTITNYGSYAGTFATPIINPPDIAILGTGRIADKPWVVDGEVKVRKVLPLSLTFDHRVVDGVESAKFLHRVIRYLEDPAQIFIEST
jgi:pyruvate dehydrogenase E2 component (dihydrolipoamide acetyltransferase)